jgi:4'-phosphopantetheinyl transferase
VACCARWLTRRECHLQGPDAVRWESPPTRPVLGDSEIHLWLADLDLETPISPHLWRVLSPDEAARANRFRFQEDRERFARARATLRTLLGLYTGASPVDLRFSYELHGKPSLTREYNSESLQFNLAHSQGRAVYTFTRGRAIGVDLEVLRPNFDWDKVAEQVLSLKEIDSILTLPEEHQLRAFFTLWARKEALAKALGGGLALPLRQWDLLGEGATAIRVSGERVPDSVGAWSLLDLEIGCEWVAAVAVEGEMPSLLCWKYEPTF